MNKYFLFKIKYNFYNEEYCVQPSKGFYMRNYKSNAVCWCDARTYIYTNNFIYRCVERIHEIIYMTFSTCSSSTDLKFVINPCKFVILKYCSSVYFSLILIIMIIVQDDSTTYVIPCMHQMKLLDMNSTPRRRHNYIFYLGQFYNYTFICHVNVYL